MLSPTIYKSNFTFAKIVIAVGTGLTIYEGITAMGLDDLGIDPCVGGGPLHPCLLLNSPSPTNLAKPG